MDEEAIFTVASEMESADERSAYLDRVCAGHALARRRIEDLLSAHFRPDGFLNNAVAAWNAELAVEEPRPGGVIPGTVIGPYKLLEQIGEGCMGLVFMAEQTHPVRRKVALKVLKPGMETRQVVARFEAERQALAMMDHPHIAKIYDAGTIGGVARAGSMGSRRGARRGSRFVTCCRTPRASGAGNSQSPWRTCVGSVKIGQCDMPKEQRRPDIPR
jgi:hypothetical protein